MHLLRGEHEGMVGWALSQMLSALAVVPGVSASSWKLGAVVRGT
jgi:hypothetical protein